MPPAPLATVLLLTLCLLGCSTFKPPNDRDISAERKQRNDAAARQFEQARDFAEFEAAQGRWRERDLQGCRERLESLLARNPDHLDGRLLLAETLLAANCPHEAVRCMEPALRAHAADARVQYTMGLVWDAAGETARALSYYERAAQLQPDNELYSVVLRKAVSSVQGKRPAQDSSPLATALPAAAVKQPAVLSATHSPSGAGEVVLTSYLESASAGASQASADLIVQPASIVAEFGPARPNQASNADHGKGADSAGRAEQADRAGSRPVRELLGQASRALAEGSLAAARTSLEQAIAARPEDPQVPISAAVLALQSGQPQLAVELLEPAVRQFPNSAPLYRALGTAYYRQGDYLSSQRALQRALSLDKSSALSYFLMGCTLAKVGQDAAAETHFRQAELLDSRYAERRVGAAGSPSTTVR